MDDRTAEVAISCLSFALAASNSRFKEAVWSQSPGEDVQYAGDGRPTYAGELKRRIAKQEALKGELERAITEYERVLRTWTPEKYAVTGAPKKLETVHMEMPRRNSRGDAWTGISCRFTRSGSASNLIAKTNDPAKVTCKRCRALLGLPALSDVV